MKREKVGLSALFLGAAAYIGRRNWRQRQRDRAQLAAYIAQSDARPALPVWTDLPTVSILVAAWNEEAHLGRFLDSFHALRYPHKQLVLCAGGNDATGKIAQAAAGDSVIVVPQASGMGKQRALHHAFRQTTGKLIFLTDADCILDDDSFERTIYPLANAGASVSTGDSQPRREQLTDTFVIWQAVTRLYGVLNAAATAQGLLGRNCAMRRDLLVASGGLAADAVTGTDYVLAKKLLAQGATIERITRSRIQTDFPETPRDYIRQQRRWLRNVAWQGQRFGAWAEVRTSVQTSLIGLMMLVLPLIGVLFPPLLLVWGLLLWQTLLARWRYWQVGCVLLGIRPKPIHLLHLPMMTLLDFTSWAATLGDYAIKARRDQW